MQMILFANRKSRMRMPNGEAPNTVIEKIADFWGKGKALLCITYGIGNKGFGVLGLLVL